MSFPLNQKENWFVQISSMGFNGNREKGGVPLAVSSRDSKASTVDTEKWPDYMARCLLK
jgi:hypothetical protein